MKRVQVMAAAVVLAAGLPLVCPAQPAASSALPSHDSLERYTSGALIRLGLLDLRAVPAPGARDFAITLRLMQAAQRLDPDNVETVRRCVEAAWNASDQDALLEYTRQLIKLDPADTVAQLRLLTAQIGRMQTADERLAAYDRALGPDGLALDPSVRSRLALDAAMLLRERGDEDGYLKRLKLATQLDVANKEAAYMALQAYSERSDNMGGRLELLSNLLMADPLDPAVLTEIRNTLARGGALNQASRFHDIAAKIYRASGTGDDAQLDLDSLILQWRISGPQPALKLLQDQLASARRNAERAAQLGTEKGGLSLGRRAQDVRLAISFEEPRMGTAMAVKDYAEVHASLTDMLRSIRAQQDVLHDPGRRPQDLTEDKVAELEQRFTALGESWRGLVAALAPEGLKAPPPAAKDETKPPAEAPKAGADQPKTDQPKEAAAPQPAPEPPPPDPTLEAVAEGVLPVVDGWRAIQAGDLEKAKAAFARNADKLDAWTVMGNAVVLDKQGSPDAAKEYHKLAASDPLTVLGAIAATREAELIAQAGKSPASQWPDAPALESFGKTIPSWIDGMVEHPWNFQSLSVVPLSQHAAVSDRVRMRVKLRNLAPIPLSVGSESPINSRLLFLPSMETGGRVQAPDSEVVDVNRRLRLMPGEELECVVWPEAGAAGCVAERACDFPTRISWRVLQGFEAIGDVTRAAGPACVEVHTDTVLHEQLPEARLSTQELTARILAAKDSDIPAVLTAASIALAKGDQNANDQIAGAAARRYSQWSAQGRMLALTLLPPTAKVAALKVFDQEVAKDSDPDVLLVAAVARPAGPDDPILAAAAAVASSTRNAALAAVVSGQQDRMRDGVKTYSEVGVPDHSEPPAAPPAPAPGQPPPDGGSPVSSAPAPTLPVPDSPAPPKH